MPQGDLRSFPPDSTGQQAAVLAVADQDAFNWGALRRCVAVDSCCCSSPLPWYVPFTGYDPVHYGVPEGSYATDPDGEARVLEFRTMVQALHGMGLRVVLDVVYNHTFATGANFV